MHPAPRVVVSRCLGFAACRWNGSPIPDGLVRALEPHVTFLPVCPEMDIGLGVPRDPVRVVLDRGALRLCQPSTNKDLTDQMRRFADRFLDEAGTIHAAILKRRSPSCAVTDADYYDDPVAATPSGRGPGLFAKALIERFPGLLIEDELHLMDRAARDAFLARLPFGGSGKGRP